MSSLVNYVKFQRGTQAAYNNLKNKRALNINTLYFIYNDANDPDAGGLLYLGERLIGGTDSVMGASSLNDLTDVNTSGSELADGMILQYNNSYSEWRPSSLRGAITNSGALASVSSVTKSEGQTDAQALAAADANPVEGDIIFVSGTPYIYDGANWQGINSSLETRIAVVEAGLQAVGGQIATAVANANHLKYVVESELPVITESNVSNLTNTVVLVPRASGTGTNNQYDEYLFVDNNFEKLGVFGADLSGYVTTSDFNTTVESLEDRLDTVESGLQAVSTTYVTNAIYNAQVGNLNDLLTATGKESTTIVDEIIDIQECLKWQELPNNNE